MKVVLCIFVTGSFLFAGDFGRITGQVTDSETATPLVGADIMIKGTEYGAATDENGEYVVLYVPVGTYAIAASYIGYTLYEYTNVVVHADQITRLQFRLGPAIIEVGGVTAVAERPMIIASETSTSRAVNAQEMTRLPATTVDQILGLQPGVTQSFLGTHVRGGRDDEITYYVDGIAAKDPQIGAQSAIMNYSAVEEITTMSGGFDAEYGDALSGIINIVTKEGGIKHTGTFNYFTDEMFYGSDKLNFGYNRYDISLGGPIPLHSRFRYFLSGELMLTDAFQEARYKVPSPRMDYRLQAKLSYHLPMAKGKVTLTGFNERRQWVWWGPLNYVPNMYKYFENMPMIRKKNWIASAKVNYMITQKTLASLNLGITHFNCAGTGARDYAWEDSVGRRWYEDYRLKAEHLIDYLLDGTLPLKDVIVDSVRQYHEPPVDAGVDALRRNPYGNEAWFRIYGDYHRWLYWHNDDYQMRLGLTHSTAKVHELDAGFHFVQYRSRLFWNYWITSSASWDYYDKNPYKIAAYVQDKMDFGGLIARLGVRFDYLEPKSFTYADLSDMENDSIVHGEAQHTIAPRLGFSLPVTDRMKFRFNYGHYYQFPHFDHFYTSTDTVLPVRLILYGGGLVGNINIRPQRTVMYEIGVENRLTDDIVSGITVYFKDIYDLIQNSRVLAIPRAYTTYLNISYGNVKGLEVSLHKRMSNMWALGINYTLQFARGTAAVYWEWIYDYYLYGLLVPAHECWLEFDERHLLHANLDFELPKDFFFVPLQDFSSSLILSFHSGHPYTPEDLKGNRLGDENSARMPGYWNVDWRIRRRFSLGPINLVLSGIINNLFNTEQVLYVYSTTGRPDDHGDHEPPLDQFTNIPMSSLSYSPQVDHNHDGLATRAEYKQEYMAMVADYYENPLYYKGPFRVQLGIGIEF